MKYYSVASLPLGFALAFSVASLPRASCSHSQSLPWVLHFALAILVASLPRALCFAIAFSSTLLPRALRFALARVSRFVLTKIFENKRVSIALKRSETHRNTKNITLLTRNAQSASSKAQPYLPHVNPRVPRNVPSKFHADWSKTVGVRGILKRRDVQINT